MNEPKVPERDAPEQSRRSERYEVSITSRGQASVSVESIVRSPKVQSQVEAARQIEASQSSKKR